MTRPWKKDVNDVSYGQLAKEMDEPDTSDWGEQKAPKRALTLRSLCVRSAVATDTMSTGVKLWRETEELGVLSLSGEQKLGDCGHETIGL